MTVFLGPDEGMRATYATSNGQPAAGKTALVYLDSGGSTLATIKTYDGSNTPGAVITGSRLTLDKYGQIPLFWFPDFPTSTVPTLYISVNNGPLTAIGPDMNIRVTALEAGGGGGGGGTPSNTVVTEQAYGQASNAGAAGTYSRGDHTHGTPAAPAVPAPATTVTSGTAYGTGTAVGAATTYAREDHQHGTVGLATVAPTTSAVGDAAALGTAVLPAKSDHTHGREAFAAPTAQTTYGLGSATGTATTVPHSDHAHGTPALTANAAGASAVGDTAAVGTGTAPARDDHRHAREAFGAVAVEQTFGSASTNGVATTVARSDHAHGNPSLASTAPTTSAVGDAAAVGVGTTAAKADHTHGREAFGAVTAQTSYGAASASGSATTISHSDHTHGTVALPTPAQVGSPALSQVTTKGDILAATASATLARLGVGADGTVLTADSTQATGLKWGAAGGAGTYSLPDGIDPPSGDAHVVPPGAVAANLATVSGTGFFVPVPMGATTRTLNTIAVEITAASGASGVLRAVLFSSTGRRPNVSLIDFGTVAATGTGVVSWTALSQSMSANTLYYLAIIPQVAAGGSLRATQHNNPYVTIHTNLPVASSGWACYAMSGLAGAVTNGTAFVYLDVDPSPRVGLSFA